MHIELELLNHEEGRPRLGEAATRLADRKDAVPDAIWNEAARHYDEKGLAALVLWIATTNFFNRLNASTRQAPGSWERSETLTPDPVRG